MGEVIILFKQTKEVADFLKWKNGHQEKPLVFAHEMKREGKLGFWRKVLLGIATELANEGLIRL